ncbi:MAG: TetR family transcriptional regulator [Geodermatophilaceae bacterium]
MGEPLPVAAVLATTRRPCCAGRSTCSTVQGYDGTSMGDLARELGLVEVGDLPPRARARSTCSRPLSTRLSTACRAAIDAAVGTAGAGHDRLRAAAHRRRGSRSRSSSTHLPAVTLLLRVHGNSEIELAALKRRRARSTSSSRPWSQAAADEGALRADMPPDLISRLLFGMVNSLIEWYRPGGAVDPDVLARAITDLAFDGLALPARDPSTGQAS